MDTAPLLDIEEQNTDAEQETKKAAHPRLGKCVSATISLAALVALIYFWHDIIDGCKAFMNMIGSWGLYSVPIIALCCTLSTASCAPLVYVFELGAGAIYYNMTKSTGMALAYSCAACCPGIYLGSLIAFVVGRKLLKPAIQKFIDTNAALTIVNQIVSEEGWPFAFLLGMNPAIPFELLNYALSITDLKFFHFMISSLGVMPVIAFETYTGVAIAAVATSFKGGSHSSPWEAIIQFSIATVLITGMGIYAKRKFNVKAEARKHDHRIVLDPQFLLAVSKFKAASPTHRAHMKEDHLPVLANLHVHTKLQFMHSVGSETFKRFSVVAR